MSMYHMLSEAAPGTASTARNAHAIPSPAPTKTAKIALPLHQNKFVTTLDVSHFLLKSSTASVPSETQASNVSAEEAWAKYHAMQGAYYAHYYSQFYATQPAYANQQAWPGMGSSMPVASAPVSTASSSYHPPAYPTIAAPVVAPAAAPAPVSTNAAAKASSTPASTYQSQWPVSLEIYATKVLASKQAGILEIRKWLMAKVNKAKKAGVLWDIDWSKERLPTAEDMSREPELPKIIKPAAKSYAETVKAATSAGNAFIKKEDPAKSTSRWDNHTIPSAPINVQVPKKSDAPQSLSALYSKISGLEVPKRPRNEITSAIPDKEPKRSRFDTKASKSVADQEVDKPAESAIPPVVKAVETPSTGIRKSKKFDKADVKAMSKNSAKKDADAMLQLVFGQRKSLSKLDWDRLTVKGRCMDIEKRYFRLIEAPDPETVRPEHVLHKSLELVLRKHAAGAEYKAYVKDQLKSIRQDLTVQRIKNAFTVSVYEAHARIALENKDAAEFNQCQAQLFALYKLGLPGSRMEFIAYRLIYHLYSGAHETLRSELKELTVEERSHPFVRHALDVRSAVCINNYHRFFRLVREAPNHGPFAMQLLFHRIRIRALQAMVAGYRPNLPFQFVVEELSFDDANSAKELIERAGGVLAVADGDVSLDCRASNITMVHELDSTELDQLMQSEFSNAMDMDNDA